MSKTTAVVIAIVSICAVITFSPQIVAGQTSTATTNAVAASTLPDAPTPAIEKPRSRTARIRGMVLSTFGMEPGHFDKTYFVSIIALLGGEGFDTWQTHRNMTHTRWLCAWNSNLSTDNVVMVSSRDGGTYDVGKICPAFQGYPPANAAYDITQIGMYVESGWMVKTHFADERDFRRVEAGNLISDAAQLVLAHYLVHGRNPLRRRAAIAWNFFHAEQHAQGGMENWLGDAKDKNANDAFKNHPNALPDWMDAFPSWWGKH